MQNKKIAIIAPGFLPIPAIFSGGIEIIIENVINQNEKTPKVDITVISKYSKDTKKLEEKYKYTNFKNVEYSFIRRCYNFIDRQLLSKVFKYQHYHNGILQIMRIVETNEFDKILIFGNDEQIKPLSLVVQKEKIVFYLATLMLKKVGDFSLCNKLIVGSTHTKENVLKHTNKLDESKIKVIRAGLDTDMFFDSRVSAFRSQIRKQINLEENIPLICYLGRIVASKGVVVLLKAALSIKASIPFKLILIGSFGSNFGLHMKSKITEDELEIRNLISQMGEKCIVTGFIANEELPKYLSAVDIGVVPSICEDVAPFTYFQYQVMGISSIVSDGGGIPEYFSPDYSLMVKRGPDMINDLAESLSKLILNKPLRDSMADCAVKNREYLGVKRYYDDFIKLVLED